MQIIWKVFGYLDCPWAYANARRNELGSEMRCEEVEKKKYIERISYLVHGCTTTVPDGPVNQRT